MTTTPSALLLDVGGVFLLPSRAHIRSALQKVGHAISDDTAIDRAHYVSVRVFPMDLEGDEFLGPLWTRYRIANRRRWIATVTSGESSQISPSSCAFNNVSRMPYSTR